MSKFISCNRSLVCNLSRQELSEKEENGTPVKETLFDLLTFEFHKYKRPVEERFGRDEVIVVTHEIVT